MCTCPNCKTTIVTMRAFTGMRIGDFPIIKESKTLYYIKTQSGTILTFNKTTGIQRNSTNNKFANRIEILQ